MTPAVFRGNAAGRPQNTNETANEAPKRRIRIPRDEAALRRAGLRCVLEIIGDRQAKASDRLSAVKTLMDCFAGQDGRELNSEIRIRFDDLPSGFAD